MSSPVVQLPEAQLRPLLAAYDASVRTRRLHTLFVLACIVAAMLLASVSAEVSPARLIENIGRFPSYIIRLFQLESGQPAWTDFTEWFWGLPRWLRLLGETLLMAYVGTLLGAIGAFGLSFLAAANVGPSRWLRFAVRRVCELCRTVPLLVFALLFVIAFGLGPMAGVLAVVIHTLGALTKQFAEVVENIVRESAVMGFVGAGGIGQDLIEAIRKFYYSDVSAILLLILVTVAIIDTLTSKVRHQLIGREERR